MTEQRDTATPTYRFKSPQGQAEFMAAYDRALAQWPVPYQSVFVPTRFGSTHVIVSGSEAAPPLVLLHTAGTNSTVWRRNVAALSQSHRVWLVDIVGLPNKSSDIRGLRTRAEAVEWLLDVFHGLGVEKPHLGGLSYGGWLSFLFAIAQPERIGSAVLMSPGGLAQENWSVALRFLFALLFPSRKRVEGFWRSWALDQRWIDDTVVEPLYLAARHFPISLGFLKPGRFADEELRGVRVPILLLEGAHNPAYDAHSAVERARRLVPGLRVELFADSGYMVPFEQTDRANQLVLDFLAGTAPPRSSPELSPS